MPKSSLHPVPKIRFHGGQWRIFWTWKHRQYSIATGYADPKKRMQAESDLRLISAALAMDDPQFPEQYREAPAVVDYIRDRISDVPGGDLRDPENWLADYAHEICAECAGRWAEWSIKAVEAMGKRPGGLAAVTADQASAHLAAIADAKSPATRNRAFAACSRFYKWAVRTGRTKTKPFSGVKTLKEERGLDIVHCTPEEREKVIALAEATGWREWIAIPIAFYAGMRREEVANLEWPDVRLPEGIIAVRKTKTKTSRTIPLNARLEAILSSVPAADRSGFVVKIDGGIDRLWHLDNLVRTI